MPGWRLHMIKSIVRSCTLDWEPYGSENEHIPGWCLDMVVAVEKTSRVKHACMHVLTDLSST
jgi:hypothetical protein